jgi:hypothetical protein
MSGQDSKKGTPRRPDHCLGGRVGLLSHAGKGLHVRALWTDTGPALALYPRSGVGDEWDHHGRSPLHAGARRSLGQPDSVLFLQHLVPHVSAKLLVIWDGSPIHKGEVRTFLADGGAKQIQVEQLPPHAPDLTPGEGVWQDLKQVEMRNLCCLPASGASAE